MKKRSLILVVALLIVAIAAAGAFAYFNDAESVGNNGFTAGKLDLQLGASTLPFSVTNLVPGDSGSAKVTLTNAGSINGTLNINVTNIVESENDMIEPEIHPGWGTADYDGNGGELKFFLAYAAYVDVNRNGSFDAGDIQLTYNSQQSAYPGFWATDFHYHPLASMFSWNNVMTLAPGQSVDLVVMYNWPGPQAVGDGNYSHNIAMTDGESFNLNFNLAQIP